MAGVLQGAARLPDQRLIGCTHCGGSSTVRGEERVTWQRQGAQQAGRGAKVQPPIALILQRPLLGITQQADVPQRRAGGLAATTRSLHGSLCADQALASTHTQHLQAQQYQWTAAAMRLVAKVGAISDVRWLGCRGLPAPPTASNDVGESWATERLPSQPCRVPVRAAATAARPLPLPSSARLPPRPAHVRSALPAAGQDRAHRPGRLLCQAAERQGCGGGAGALRARRRRGAERGAQAAPGAQWQPSGSCVPPAHAA